jgi:hypothetical protein
MGIVRFALKFPRTFFVLAVPHINRSVEESPE